MRGKLLQILSASLFFSCGHASAVEVTYALPWDGTTFISNWGSGNNSTHTYAQSFGSSYLPIFHTTTSISFYYKLLSGSPQSYTFSLYKYGGNGPLSANPLSTNSLTPFYTTGVLTAPSSTSSFTKVTYDLSGLQLSGVNNSPAYYYATISTLGLANSDGEYGIGGTGLVGSGYGGFIYNNNQTLNTSWQLSNAYMAYEVTGLSN